MKPPPIDLRYAPHPATHINDLWLAVMLQAIQDCQYLNDDSANITERRDRRVAAQDAIDFLNHKERYAPVCAAAGLRPQWAIRKIRVAGYRRETNH